MKKICRFTAFLTALVMMCGTVVFPDSAVNESASVQAFRITENYVDIDNVYYYYEKYEDHIVITGADYNIPLPSFDCIIPDTIEGLPVTEIEGKMVDFKKLFSLHIPDTVTKIGPHAFENCDLEELELPDGLEEIGEYAFADNALSSISLGPSLKSIGNGAFAGNHITEINVDRKNKYYTVEDGRLFNADKTELLLTEFLYTGVKFIVPDTVKKISGGALNCMELDTLVLPEGLEELGEKSLFYCEIGDVTLPSTLKKIGNAAFGIAENISLNNNKYFETEDDILYSKSDNRLITVMRKEKYIDYSNDLTYDIEIKEGTQSIDSYAFYNIGKIESVKFPESLKTISHHAFFDSVVFSVIFSDNIEYIGERAFEDSCLKGSLQLPESLKEIGDYAFLGCNIDEVYIPDSIDKIGSGTFECCYNITRVRMSSKFMKYRSYFPDEAEIIFNDISDTVTEDNVLFSKDKKILYSCPDLFDKTYIVPSEVECIADHAFYNNYYLEKVVLPENLKRIEESAFELCNLSDIEIPDTVTSIGNAAFKGCDEMQTAYIPDSVTDFGTDVFADCYEISSVRLPDGMSEIPAGTFTNCTKIKSFTVPKGIEKIDSSMLPPNITELLIPSSFTEVDESVYSFCTSLKFISGLYGSEAEKFADVHNITFVPDKKMLSTDVNKDFKVNIVDYILTKNEVFTEKSNNSCYDVNKDEKNDVTDLFIVLDELFGNPNTIDRGLSDIKTVSYDVDFETGTFCDIYTEDDFIFDSLNNILENRGMTSDNREIILNFFNEADEYVRDGYVLCIGSVKRNNKTRVSVYPEKCSVASYQINIIVNSKTTALNDEKKGTLFFVAIPKEYYTGQTVYFDNESNATYSLPAKPVIYLYPEEETEVNVKLDLDDKTDLTFSYPEYPGSEGWTVTAKPDSTLIDENGREYSYLFWEAESKRNWDMSEGFVVKGSDTVQFLQEKLEYLGLTPREYNEFIVYWMPKMQNNNYNLITFQTDDYEDMAKLTITPEPDSIQRVFMTFKPLDEYINVREQQLKPFERHGFSVIEWGGAEITSD